MDGKSLLEHISGLQESLRKYLETKISYYGLLAFEKAAKLLTAFLGNGVVIAALLVALIFLSGAAALFVGNLLESIEAGLLIVGGFYLLLALILFVFRSRIFGPYVIRSLAEVFFQDDEEASEK
jgi:hypothetical protein